ncbi:translation initiation factor eIF-1A [Edhazardia aedis USNM 41457]|uniref:Translation initiation factor eIF-1A n=1 Tax=Edhazardia aedis (strain USNM 41457) TaxID=1003232 RepID=J9DTL4_EDHAE|nr:translation initiation factor eIF-1A [Edhazardia aedis USNM 41457]|eukprot:EJW04617.1 translation initiation factor eIF-1A [Edhazardia aedis USNM 41457]
MPKRARSRKKQDNSERPLSYAIDGESVYGQVIQPLGGSRFEVNCADSITRIAKVAGRMHKRVWIHKHDFVLVSLRESEPKKGDIIVKYFPPEVKVLRESNLIPANFMYDDLSNDNIEFDNI